MPSSGQPVHIAPGPGGMWFTENAARIGLITLDGRVTEYPVNHAGFRIVAGPDANLWFMSDGFLSRMTPSGVVTDFPLSGRAWGIAVGPDGNIWFTELQRNGSNSGGVLYGYLGRATMAGEITEILIEAWAEDITPGPDGNSWLPDWTEVCYDAIVRVTPSGRETRFVLPGGLHCPGDVGPAAVTVGSDGNVWFTGARTEQVGRITPSSQVTIFNAPGVWGIAAGPDGNLWFTESSANKVGRLTTLGELVEFGIPSANCRTAGHQCRPRWEHLVHGERPKSDRRDRPRHRTPPPTTARAKAVESPKAADTSFLSPLPRTRFVVSARPHGCRVRQE